MLRIIWGHWIFLPEKNDFFKNEIFILAFIINCSELLIEPTLIFSTSLLYETYKNLFLSF